MVYEIKDGCLIVNRILFPKKIDIAKITRIVCGASVKFYSEDGLIYQIGWSGEIQKIAEDIYFHFPNKVLEYSNCTIDKWKQISGDQFQDEVNKMATLMELEIDKYQERVPFDIHHEVAIVEERQTAVMTVWGEKNSEKIYLFSAGKKEVLWGGQLLLASPKILSHHSSESVVALDEKCIIRMKQMMETAINALDRYGWRGTEGHVPTGFRWGIGIFVAQLTLLMLLLCVRNVVFKVFSGILMLVILGVLLFRIYNGKGYHWKWIIANLLLGATGFIIFGVLIIFYLQR